MVLGASTSPIASGQYAEIVLTRDSATGTVTVYTDGVAQFSFMDSMGFAVLGDAANDGNAFLTLCQDDGQGIGSTNVDENTSGDIARLRLYDGVLSAEQVAVLQPVPEPATWGLLALAVWWCWRCDVARFADRTAHSRPALRCRMTSSALRSKIRDARISSRRLLPVPPFPEHLD
ncbi:MAG: LamG domain-containing protein [Verrucomicrobiota bacterium]|nr:LamG domain-containing protein [Verrucomicrobiota bacterium]